MKSRSSKEIRKWMIDKELLVEDIAKASEVDQSLASRTIDGKRNNRRVLRTLVAKGCPVSVLDLPADMDVNEILKAAA